MTKQTTQGVNIADNAPDGLAISDAEVKAAQKDGAKDAVKEAAKDSYTALTDGNLPGEPNNFKWHGYDEVQLYADRLDLGVGEFEKFAADKNSGVPENKLYGLLAMERNGQNRTPYVKALMKRLGLKADELPGGGPAYTNAIDNITDL